MAVAGQPCWLPQRFSTDTKDTRLPLRRGTEHTGMRMAPDRTGRKGRTRMSADNRTTKVKQDDTAASGMKPNNDHDTGGCPHIGLWRAVDGEIYGKGYVVAELRGGGMGLMTVDYERVFDGTDEWLRLDVIGKADPTGHARFGASQIELPRELHEQIVSMATKHLCWATAWQIHEDHRDSSPELQAYVCATSFVSGNDDIHEFTDSFLPWLEEVAQEYDGYAEELNVPQLKRLVSEAAKVWGQGR